MSVLILRIQRFIRFSLIGCGYALGLLLAWTSFTMLMIRRGELLEAVCGFGAAIGVWQIVGFLGRPKFRAISGGGSAELPVTANSTPRENCLLKPSMITSKPIDTAANLPGFVREVANFK